MTSTPRGETFAEYGGLAVKLFRQTEPGVNPDLELRRFLTERTGFDNVADVYGAIEYESGQPYTLGVLQQSFPGAPSAWDAFAAHCRAWLTAIRSGPPPAEPPAGGWAGAPGPGVRLPAPGALQPALEQVGRLAGTTAELHLALSSLSEDPDLRPQPFSLLYQHSLYQSLRARVRQELRSIRDLGGGVDGEVAAALAELSDAEGQALERLDPIRRRQIRGWRIRLHGDYRLDEIRMVDGEFVLEDFSGDRAQLMSERRLRASPLRDVAQMLRSIDYVAISSALAAPPDRQGWAAWWSRALAVEFVRAYLEAMEDSPVLPDDPEAVDALLGGYALTRALRELHWELGVRRDWVPVALAGVRRLLAQQPSLIT